MSGVSGQRTRQGQFAEVFLAFLKLGLTSFGGPVAHIGYFRDEFVARRRWLDDGAYAEYVALAQFLPGPASSQVGLAVGLHRAGLAGSLAAWLGFTLPSAVIMTGLGLGVAVLDGLSIDAVLHGLKLVAVAVVMQALWQMARQLCPDRPRIALAGVAAIVVLALPPTVGQLSAMAVGALVGFALFRKLAEEPGGTATAGPRRHGRLAVIALALFFGLLVLLPLLAGLAGVPVIAMIDSYYRSGALVFGGGHVILPLLEAEVVPPGWADKDTFLAGYGAAQALPGPLFTFSAYLGALSSAPVSGLGGAVICLLAIFLPSYLLILGILPFWSRLRGKRPVVAAVAGTNAAVVGVLIAALYDPLWMAAVITATDFALVIAALLLLALARLPPWLVVVLGALAGLLFTG